MDAIPLEPVDAITVTTLVDNVTDSLLADEGPAKRPPMAAAPRMPASLFTGGDTDDALLAEHGSWRTCAADRANGSAARDLNCDGKGPQSGPFELAGARHEQLPATAFRIEEIRHLQANCC